MDVFLAAENILLIGSVLLFFSILVSKTGFRFGIPVLLLFLIVGILAGSDGLGVQFNNAGEAQFIGMVSLSIILFSGGMDTKIKEIRPVLKEGIVLSTVGVLLTTLFTGFFIYWIAQGHIALPLSTALLLAAVMSSTDSASVFGILRSQNIRLKENLRPMLELESGSNDPMAYMLTVVLIQAIQSSTMNGWNIVLAFLIQFVVGSGLGWLLGKFAVRVINRINIGNKSLYPILLGSMVFFTFTITDLLKGNGYLAVYIAGIVIGNHKLQYRREILTFFDGITWFFQIVLFLTLGLLVNPHEMLEVAFIAMVIGLFMILVARPLSVFISLLPFKKLSLKGRLFVSWVGLRGAVPIIFATYPVLAGVEGAHVIFNIVFFITLLSLIIQGTTIPFIARKLGLSVPIEIKEDNFGIELPEDIVDTDLREIAVTQAMLEKGNKLMNIDFPEKSLVMLVKRDGQFIVPNGRLELQVNDKLLLIKGKEKEELLPEGKE